MIETFQSDSMTLSCRHWNICAQLQIIVKRFISGLLSNVLSNLL